MFRDSMRSSCWFVPTVDQIAVGTFISTFVFCLLLCMLEYLGDRQIDGKPVHVSVVNDCSAVVSRRVRIENAVQQRFADLARKSNAI